MKPEKKKPVQPARSLNSWVEDFFNLDFLNFFGNESWVVSPSVNVREDENRYVLELAAPGLKREDFKIEVVNQVLSLSSDKREEKTEEEENYRRREFNYSTFQRTFQLPEEVDPDKITANYEDGVLSVTLPKKEEAATNKKRRIEIL